MNMEYLIEEAKLLFTYFGWYSIALVLGTFGLMIPLNMLYRAIMKTDALSRLRKVVGGVSVYVIAMALIALFTATVVKQPVTFMYVLGASLPCGMLAQSLWAMVKLVRDYGFEPIMAKVKQSNSFKQSLIKLGLNSKVIDLVLKNIDKYLKDKQIVNLDGYMAKQFEITTLVRTQISGFIENGNINSAVQTIISKIKSKYEA